MDPLVIVKKASSQRAGLLSVGTFSSPNTTLPGNVQVTGTLSVQGEITNNVLGALSLRVFDDTGLYALRTLTAGNPLPSPMTSKPVLEQQVTGINLSNPTFGTISAGYSLKINGYVQPPTTGTYLFRTTYRDGASLYVAARKLLDSWTYQGTVQQSVGTLTMYQNVWYNFAIEHAAASSAERLLVEWSYPGGTYATLQHGAGAFTFAYDMKEIPGSLMGTSYIYGRANFADVANLSAGIALPNAALFSGNTSELNNDVGFLKNGFSTLSGTSLSVAGTVSAGALAFSGTSAGTNIQLINSTTVSAGTTTTIAYAGLGVTPGTALDNYALTGHRWWTGSSGTSSGTVSMQLSTSSLSVSTPIVAGSVLCGYGSVSTLTVSNARFQGLNYVPSDSSVNNYFTPIAGTITAGTLSPYSDPTYGCLSFPGGTLSYIDYNYLAYPGLAFDWSAQDFTAECRLFTTSLPGSLGWGIFGRGIPNSNSGLNDWSLNVYNSGYVGLYYYSSSNSTYNFVRGSTPISLNSWNHLAFSYVNSTGLVSVFLNGSLTASATKTSVAYSTAGDFVVGALPAYSVSSYPGVSATGPALITDLRVIKGTAAYTGSTYPVPVTPLSPIANTVLLLRSVKSGAYIAAGNVGINQVNPSYALDVVGPARISGILFQPTINLVQFGSGSLQSVGGNTTNPLNLATTFGPAQLNNSFMSNSVNANCVFTVPSTGVWNYSMSLLWGGFVPSLTTGGTNGSNVYAPVYFSNSPTEYYPFVGLWLTINIERFMTAGDTIQAAIANGGGNGTVQGNRFLIHQRCRSS